MKTERGRMLYLIRSGAVILCIGLLYLLFVSLTGKGIPCLFHLATGFYCPGCGITRMIVSLAQLDIVGALRQNALVMLCLPFFVYFSLRHLYLFVKNGSSEISGVEKRCEQILLIIAFVLAILFSILRNLDMFFMRSY